MDISKLEPTSHHRLSPGHWKCIGIPVLTLLGIYSASIPLWNSRFLSCSSIKGTGSSSSFSRPLAPVKLGHIKRNQAAACLLLRTLDLPAYVSILTSLIALDIKEYSSMPFAWISHVVSLSHVMDPNSKSYTVRPARFIGSYFES